MKVRTALLVLWAAAVVASGADGREFAAHSLDLPEWIEVGATLEIAVTVINQGEDSWSSDRGFHLSYHWFDSNGSIQVRDGERSVFPDDLAPLGSCQVEALLRAPPSTGEYFLQWDVVHEGVRWLSESDEPAEKTLLPVTVGRAHAATVDVGDVPARAWAGSEVAVGLTVRNDGFVPWERGGDVAVAYHWLDGRGRVLEWEGLRTPMAETVGPGESVALLAKVAVPDESGRYLLQWDMVHEGVCWFSEGDESLPPPFLFVVSPGPYLAAVPLVVALILLLLAFAVMALPGRWPRLGAFVVWGDLVWLAAAIGCKQWVVLEEAGLWPQAGAGWAALLGVGAVLALVAVVPGRPRLVLSFTAGLLATLVVFGDLVYQRFFGDLLSIASLRGAGQAPEVSASVASLIRGSDWWLWVDVAAAVLLMIVIARIQGSSRSTGRRRLSVVAGLLAVVFAASTWVVSAGREGADQVFRKVYAAQQIGVVNWHAADFACAAHRVLFRAHLSERRFSEIVDFFCSRAPDRAGRGPLFGAAEGMNVLMIQVESLQAFVPGFSIGGREVTPTLNRWLAESAYFSECYDQTEQGRSSDCEILTQASLLPAAGGAAVFLHPGNDYVGLADVLGEHGYASLSAVPFDGAFWNRRLTHRAFGFDESLFEGAFDAGETIGWGLNDRDFLLQMAKRLEGLDQPFCAWLITLSLHHPFEGFPRQHSELDVGEWEGTPFGNYLHTMHFFDGALAEFEAALTASGLLEKTVVALWGDHDAGFEWRPAIAQAMQTGVDDAGWYRSQRVPLLIRAPAVEGLVGERGVVAGHVDVAPTLAALLGVDPSPYAWLGRNLLGDPGGGPVTGEYRCWATGDFLYLNRGPDVGAGECLDLRTLEALPASTCAPGFSDAARLVETAGTVLEFDLQERIGHALGERCSRDR